MKTLCFYYAETVTEILDTFAAPESDRLLELSLELAALQNDKAVIAAYARKLDYVSNDEKLVKITGLKPAQTTLYDTGTVLRHTEPEYLSEDVCKIVSIFIFL